MNTVKKGNYYRLKTKHWLADKGYAVETVEHMQRIVAGRKIIFKKHDLFAADLLAMNDHELIFVNVIANKSGVADHVKRFLKHPFPTFVQLWIVYWEKRAREPEIIDVRDYVKGE